jgi:hypothetical protein
VLTGCCVVSCRGVQLIVNTCVMASVMGFNIFAFAVTEVERVLYQNISGFSGVNAALAVALKQRQPDRVVIPGLNAVKFKVAGIALRFWSVCWCQRLALQHIPAIVCTTATVLWVVGQLGGKESPLVVFGSFFGWFYLRYGTEACRDLLLARCLARCPAVCRVLSLD